MSQSGPEIRVDRMPVSEARQGFWHISDVLPVVLARIPGGTCERPKKFTAEAQWAQSGCDGRKKPLSLPANTAAPR